jgi:hypothetical protein
MLRWDGIYIDPNDNKPTVKVYETKTKKTKIDCITQGLYKELMQFKKNQTDVLAF